MIYQAPYHTAVAGNRHSSSVAQVFPFPGPVTQDIQADSYKSLCISACLVKRRSEDPTGAPLDQRHSGGCFFNKQWFPSPIRGLGWQDLGPAGCRACPGTTAPGEADPCSQASPRGSSSLGGAGLPGGAPGAAAPSPLAARDRAGGSRLPGARS